MNYNYHTHTYRCGHANGREEEYIQRAIQCGIKYMGFSDHIPFRCDDGFEAGHRVPFAEGKSYVEDISALREKYKNQIDIKIGFETEYYPDDFEAMLKSAIDFGAEYLILGQHYLGNEHLGGAHTNCATQNTEDLTKYVSLVTSAIKSGFISYVAHPDMMNFVGDKEIFIKEMRKICIASREYNVPLEINFLGIYDHRNYPNKIFWQIAGQEKCPVTFGFDAHDPQRAFDGESLKYAQALVSEYDLNYIGRPEIKILSNSL